LAVVTTFRVPRYIAVRLLKAIPAVLLASFVLFLAFQLIPGDAAAYTAGANATPEELAAIRQDLGLDRPILVQYWRWLSLAVVGDFGISFATRTSVLDLITSRIRPTLELAIPAIVLAAGVGIPLGFFAARRANTTLDFGATTISGIGISIPDYLVGIFGIYIFAVWWRLLPPGGYVSVLSEPLEGARYLVLPVIALAARPGAVLARFSRSAVVDVLGEDLVWTARAKGARPLRVTLRHVLPNAFIPILTILAIQVGRILSAAVVIEAVFGWPGLGGLLVRSIDSRDYAVVQALMLLMIVVFIFVNLLADVSYSLLDPRIELE
jgi:peptide/nickel transport system permease protein